MNKFDEPVHPRRRRALGLLGWGEKPALLDSYHGKSWDPGPQESHAAWPRLDRPVPRPVPSGRPPTEAEKRQAEAEADQSDAIAQWRKAARQGYAPAQFNLGVMYHGGKGTLQDYAEAALWYRKAAEQGLADAQINLGFMYANGRGVTQDYVQAHKWYNLAVAQSDAEAVKARDEVAAKMTPAQIAEAQKLAREWKAK